MRKIKKGQFGIGLQYNSPYTQKLSWNNNFGINQGTGSALNTGTGLGTVQGSNTVQQEDVGAGIGGSKGLSVLTKGLQLGSNIMGSFVKDDDPNSTYGIEQGISSVASMFGPIGMLVGAGMSAVSSANRFIDSTYSAMSKDDASLYDIGAGQNLANTALGVFGNLHLGAAKMLSSKTNDAYKTKEVDATGAWNNARRLIDANQRYGGKYLALNKGKVNKGINKGNIWTYDITKEVDKNSKITSGLQENANEINNRWLKAMYGDLGTVGQVSGKRGMKLLSKQELARIYAARKPKDEIDNYGDGGKIGVDNNVIPEGALHATKNNLEKINPELDEVTPKGIPVIVTDMNGDYKQVAEIEREELVLTKEVTLAIEDLWKKGTPEDMIEAGKILAKELMENTVNNGDNKD